MIECVDEETRKVANRREEKEEVQEGVAASKK